MYLPHGSALDVSLHTSLSIFDPERTWVFNLKWKSCVRIKDRLRKPLLDHLCMSQDQNVFFSVLHLLVIMIARSAIHEM